MPRGGWIFAVFLCQSERIAVASTTHSIKTSACEVYWRASRIVERPTTYILGTKSPNMTHQCVFIQRRLNPNMETPHSHDETKGFLFGGLLTYVRDTIHDARIMSDMAARYAPALSIQPWTFLMIVCFVLFVVAKKMSGYTSAIMGRLSISAFLGAAWQYISTKIAEYASASA